MKYSAFVKKQKNKTNKQQPYIKTYLYSQNKNDVASFPIN